METKKEERARFTTTVESAAREVAHGTFEISIQKPNPNFMFIPGQSMKFCFDNVCKEDGSERRPSFTIASAPHEETLKFVFRGSESPLKTNLLQLKAGDEVVMLDVLRVNLDKAVYPETPEIPVVMLASGVGISPFRSMLFHAKHIGDTRAFHLLYSNPRERDITYKEELTQLAGDSNVNLTVTYFLTKETTPGYASGYFTKEHIAPLIESFDECPIFYVVGSPEMVLDAEQLLTGECNVPEENVRIKKYTGYEGKDDTIDE